MFQFNIAHIFQPCSDRNEIQNYTLRIIMLILLKNVNVILRRNGVRDKVKRQFKKPDKDIREEKRKYKLTRYRIELDFF